MSCLKAFNLLTRHLKPLSITARSFTSSAVWNSQPRLSVGSTASIKRLITQEDINKFAVLSGDTNPLHTDVQFARNHPLKFPNCIVHGALLNGLVSALLGTVLPGTGTVIISQQLNFPAPAFAGDEVTVTVTLTQVRKIVKASFECSVQRGLLEHTVLDTTTERTEETGSVTKKVVLYGEAKLVVTQ